MTAARYVVIRCNGDKDCCAEASTPFPARKASQVRAYNSDWHETAPDWDICPDCWAAGHR